MSYLSTILADSPKIVWALDQQSGLPTDLSGSGLDADGVVGTPTFRQAGPGPAIPAGIGYAAATHSLSFVPTSVSSNFSIETWIKMQSIGVYQTDIYNGNGGLNGWGIQVQTDGTVNYLAGAVLVGGSSVGVVSASAWTHVVVLHRGNGTQWEYWLNGVKDPATPGTSTPNAPSGNYKVGDQTNGHSIHAYAAIYETALSPAQIYAHYAAGIFSDPTLGMLQPVVRGRFA